MTPKETKKDSNKNHEFILEMRFKEGDKVKIKPQFKDDNIYEIVGFEYFTHAKNQCSGIRYQMMDSEGEIGHWAREDALELYKPKEKVSIPATENELMELNLLGKICKNKMTGFLKMITACNPEVIKQYYYIFNPETKCWEDWGEK